MSSKYCLKDAFLQSVGKLFSDFSVIHLGARKQILAICTPQIARKLNVYNFPYRYLNVTETGRWEANEERKIGRQ